MRLPRPYIPLAVRVRVADRQCRDAGVLGAVYPDDPPVPLLTRLKHRLDELLTQSPCHLDHDPPLATREKIRRGGVIVGYLPAANDPDYLVYREAVAHRIKTNVAGEHGQHPDRVLIKKARRLERESRPKRKRAWPKRKIRSRGFERRAT